MVIELDGKLARLLRRIAALAVLAAVLGLYCYPAKAELIDSIRLPDSFGGIEKDEGQNNLLGPVPATNAWARENHKPLGVHLDNYSLTRDQVEAAQQTGCGLVRLAVPMEHFLEPEESDWAVLDQVISRLSRAGLEVLPVLTAKSPIIEFYTPFCESFAQRYAKTLRYYQLLDNVNYSIGLSSQQYADLVSQSRAAILRADADALIVCGGIRGVDLTYLDLLEAQGAMRTIDILAFNLYPTEQGIESYSFRRREHSLPYMEQAVAWADQRGKAVWVTQFGVSTSYTEAGVDQTTQAAMYTRGALYLGWLGAERVIFASIQDTDPKYEVPSMCCGLIDVAGQPKASFYTLQSLNHAVSGAYHVVPGFQVSAWLYQRPDATDMLMAAELMDIPEAGALTEFRVFGIAVYGFWFYAPAAEEYRMIYWLGRDTAYPTLVTLNLMDRGLTPEQRYILLGEQPGPVEYQFGMNSAFLPYLPVGQIPGVLHFKVNEYGRPGKSSPGS